MDIYPTWDVIFQRGRFIGAIDKLFSHHVMCHRW
jgi:hypothetical protein